MKIPITKILASSLLLSSISSLAFAEETEDQVCIAGDETCAQQDNGDDDFYDSFDENARSENKDGYGDDEEEYYDDEEKEEPECVDEHSICSSWAKEGECQNNPGYMLNSCRKSCNTCNCVDTHNLCAFWAKEGECQNNPGYMLNSCRKSCNTCNVSVPAGLGSGYGNPQMIEGADIGETNLWPRLEKMDKYMSEEVIKPEYDKVRAECKNRDELCLYWAHIGECEGEDSEYMMLYCAPACETCKYIDFNYRCPVDPNEKDVFGPGDLHKMFERIVDEYGDNVTILSKPPTEEGAEFTPWAITVDDFISDEECESLIELGGLQGYERSTDIGDMKFDGTFEDNVSSSRTSENTWCTDECFSHELTQKTLGKIEKLTGVPDANSEHLQLLKYEKGQYYRVHHDYIEADDERPQGPRILTAFLYLNDVEKGGGTNFPDLDLTVMPKKGRLLLWPSVLNEDPSKKDDTTEHQALDVEEGRKYGANAWLHLRNFKKPNEIGCT